MTLCVISFLVNPYLTNGFSHHYHLGQSTFIIRGIRSDFEFLFFDEIPLSKQNSPRWDAAFCGVTSGAILFAYVHKMDARLINETYTRKVIKTPV